MKSGYFFALLFAFLSASRNVWGYAILQHWPVSITLFVSFSITAILAALWSTYSSRSLVSPYSRNLFGVLFWLNITTALSWIGSFEGMARVLPATFTTLIVGSIPIMTLIFEKVILHELLSKRAMIATFIILLGELVVCWNEFSIRVQTHHRMIIIGMIMTVMTSAFAAGNNVLARKLNNAGVSAASVYGARFWLILIIALVYTSASGNFHYLFDKELPVSFSSVVLLGIGGIAVPIFCLQIAISKMAPRYVAYIIALQPIVAWVLQNIFKIHSESNMSSLVGIIIVCGGVIYGSTIRK